MAGKAAINLDNLTALGAEKLARLVLDASARDSAFKRLVAADLAGAKGPKAGAAELKTVRLALSSLQDPSSRVISNR